MHKKSTHKELLVPAVFRYTAFFDLLADAAFQHRHAKQATDSFVMNRFARASILASALSVECAANCLIASLDLSKKLRNEIDKLSSIGKIDLYLQLRKIDGFDLGCNEVQKIAELINARNDHVHPKSSTIATTLGLPKDEIENWVLPLNLDGEHRKHLVIPKNAMFWSQTDSLSALKAVTGFFKYLFIDLLKSTDDELHRILPSRLEIGDTHILAVFEEIRTELYGVSTYGIDLSFLGLFNQKSPQ